MSVVSDLFMTIGTSGASDSIIPFFLFFAILYGFLSRVHVLERKATIFVCILLSLLVVTPHVAGLYPECHNPVEIINGAIPKTTLMIIAIVSFSILLASFGIAPSFSDTMRGALVVAGIIFIAYAFVSSQGSDCGPIISVSIPWTMLLIAAIAFVLFRFITGGPKNKEYEPYPTLYE